MRSHVAVKGVLLATGATALLSIAVAALPAGSGAARAGLVLFTLVKLALLGAAARWSLASRGRLEAGHPARRSWCILGAGFLGFLVAHLVLGVEQIVHETPPFPSVADAIFLPAQVLLATALAGFLGVYRSSGLFSEEGARRAGVAIAATAVVIGVVVLATVARLPVPWLERAVDGLYAVLDLAILVPLVLLVRLARHLGGRVGRVWGLLLAAFAVLSVGDVALGYLAALEAEPPLLLSQFPFLVAYGLAAAGSRLQLALLSD